MSDDTVIEAASRFGDQTDNMRCPVCGGEWWATDGVVVDRAGRVTGHALPLTCLSCEPAATDGGDTDG